MEYGDTAEVQVLPLNIFDEDEDAWAREWQSQNALYARVYPYYSGKIFDSAVQSNADGTTTAYFPLRINSVRKACVAHALHLWGLTSDAPHLRFLARSRKQKTSEAAYEKTQKVAEMLSAFFNSDNRPVLLREGARLFQIFGGVFFKIVPDANSSFGVSLNLVSPEYVYPIWDPTDYDKLLRVHIAFNLDLKQARTLYGYTGTVTGNTVQMVETWDQNEWRVTIGTDRSNRQVAKDPATKKPMMGDNKLVDPNSGRKVIPIFYLPRLRSGRYWGLSLADELRGLQNEFNSRMADQGDAVRFASQMHTWGRNLSRKRNPGPLRLPEGNEIFDAGDTGPNGKDPHIESIPGPNLSQSLAAYSERVEDIFYDQAGIPPVMRGIDEGSQRSGVTLAARAIPTVSMVEDYRVTWAFACTQIGYAAMLTAYAYNEGIFGEYEVKQAYLSYQLSASFAPILPRDIDAINNTISQQRAAGTMSVERALDLSPDVEDPNMELKRIEAETEAKQKREEDLLEARSFQTMAQGASKSGGAKAS